MAQDVQGTDRGTASFLPGPLSEHFTAQACTDGNLSKN